MGVDINFPKVEASVQSGAGEAVGKTPHVKLKKSKIKMPKFTFSKPKGKLAVAGSPEASVSGSKGDLKSSKASLGSLKAARLRSHTSSPKGKFSLFKSKKPSHRSNSFSDEGSTLPLPLPRGLWSSRVGRWRSEGGKSKGNTAS